MDGEALARAAKEIVAHRLSGTPVARMVDLATLEAGYACQRLANRALAKALGPVAGLKIGGTAEAARRLIGIEQPILGEVFASTVHASGARLPFSRYRRPGIETEIAVRLGRDLPARPAPYTRAEVADAIATIMAAIELVDDRYEALAGVGGPTLVADNACNAGSILGAERRFDPALALDRLGARTLVDGREVATGSGAALLGHPLEALLFAVECRRRLGLGLEAGTFVSLGTVTLPQWAEGPAGYRIEVEALGTVELVLV
ncbi:MAG: fumarylacetoacetate hydrolase family protein [Geminicoccaceae bacterium]|nr:fumarylacetoacetate hydrolase family protein [Geminicoccaceae bacterium]